MAKSRISNTGFWRTLKIVGLITLAGAGSAHAGDCGNLEKVIVPSQISVGMEPITNNKSDYDLNGDGKIGMRDAILAIQKVAGLRGSPEIPVLYSTTHNISQSSNNHQITMQWTSPCKTPEGYVYTFNSIPNSPLSVGNWTDFFQITSDPLEAGTYFFHVAPAYNCSPECSLGPTKHFGPFIIRD